MSDLAPSASNHNDTEAMAKFLSFLSHDLRGGLNGAVLMLEVVRRHLARDPAMSETLGDLEMVRRSILDTVSLMDRFVFAERLRLGRVTVNMGSINLNALLTQLVNEAQSAAMDRGTTLQLECEPDLIVSSDEMLLKRLLGCLLDNAIKFSRRKPVAIRAVSGAAANSACAVRLEFIDQGPGIAAEKVAQLFGPFNVSQAYGQGGGGMGLYIARRAARVINANLRVESAVGTGTTLIVELPQSAAGAIK